MAALGGLHPPLVPVSLLSKPPTAPF